MKFVTVRELRGNTRKLWRELAKQELVVTSNGKPIAVVTPTTEDTLESTLQAARSARALATLRRMQLASVKAGTDRMTLGEINHEIAESRKARRT